MKNLLSTTLTFWLLAFSFANAQEQISDEDILAVASAERAINAIRSAQGRFVQFASNGESAEGSLFIQRPGKLRFEYDPPNPIMILADGTWVMQVDRELEEVAHQRLKRSVMYFLLEDYVDFTKGINLIDVERLVDTTMITIERQGYEDQGYLTLFVDPQNAALQGWQTLDKQGERVTVQLQSMTYGVDQPETLFTLPRGYGRDER